METTSFFTGALAATGVVSLIYVLIYSFTIKIHKDRVNQFGFLAERAKDASKKFQAEYEDMRAMYAKSSATCDSLKKANEDLRDKVRIQAEKSLNYMIENESLRSGKPMYEKRIKPILEEKPKAESKPTKRGKNIRGADGKWVKNIGQTVEKKTPLTLGF